MSKKYFYITLCAVALLAALRLTGAMHLSWWWVTSPLWVPAALAFVLVGIAYALFRKYL